MDKLQLQNFNTELIEVTLRWAVGQLAGYSMHGSLIHAVRYVPEPNQQVWQRALRPYYAGDKPLVINVLRPLQSDTQSDGLRVLIEHASKYWDGEAYRFIDAIEPALEHLWVTYHPDTKPTSTRFEDMFGWLRRLGADDVAQQQFERMGNYALPFIECGVFYGAPHDPVAVERFLHTLQSPHVAPLLIYLYQHRSDARSLADDQ